MYAGFREKLSELGFEGAAEYASNMGFEAVEILEVIDGSGELLVKNKDDALKLRAALEAREIRVSCYSVAQSFKIEEMNADGSFPTERKLLECAEIAASLGSPYLHHTLRTELSQNAYMPSYEQMLLPIIKACERIANACEPLGLTCLYEGQGMYFNGIDKFGRFFDEMRKRCKNVGVCADIGNTLFVDVPPSEFFLRFAAFSKHVHLKDYKKRLLPPESSDGADWYKTRSGAYIKECRLGDGEVEFKKCMEALKNAGYRGAFSIESWVNGDREGGLRHALAYCNEHFRT